MPKHRRIRLAFATLTLTHGLSPALTVAQTTPQASTLPKPYVSRALKATVMPIDDAVRKQFKLAPSAKGVIVVSTQPGGIAAKSQIKPGDILEKIKGRPIEKPVDIDATVKYWGKKGQNDFRFDAYRDGREYHPHSHITLDVLSAAIDIATVGAWLAWGSPYWSYSSYYSSYSYYIVESYSYSETYIEETSSSSEYSSSSEEYASEDSSQDASDGNDDTDGDGDTDSDSSDGDDGGSDDGGGDDGGGDDGGGDDGGGDDGGGDDGGGGGDPESA